MDYQNAFGMAQNQNPVPNNPFYSGMLGQRNQANAYPFMQQQFAGNQMNLMKQGQELQEFMSPLAQQGRQDQIQFGMDQRAQERKIMPHKTEAEIQKYKEDIRLAPYVTDEKIAKAGEVMRNLRSAPQRELVSSLGSLYDLLHDLPNDTQRAQVYLREIARWRMMNPGQEIPEGLRQYDVNNTMGDLAAIRYNQINTPEQVGKERITNLQGGYGLRREEIEQQGGVRRAEIAAGASRYAADKGSERAQAQENPARAVARLRRLVAQGKGTDEDKAELESYVAESFDKTIKNHPSYMGIASNMMNNDPNKKMSAYQAYDQLREEYYKANGLEAPTYEYKVKGKQLLRRRVK